MQTVDVFLIKEYIIFYYLLNKFQVKMRKQNEMYDLIFLRDLWETF